MGFLSYLVARSQTDEYNQGEPNTPLPCWYQHLLTRGFSDAWLEGLTSSTVCSFNSTNSRSGIVMQHPLPSRATIEWLLSLDIPLWFVWSSVEEEAISRDPHLAYLRPPNHLVENALAPLLASTNIPLAALVIKRFYALRDDDDMQHILHLSSASAFVFEYVVEQFLENSTITQSRKELTTQLQTFLENRDEDLCGKAEAAANLPQQGMVTREVDKEPPVQSLARVF